MYRNQARLELAETVSRWRCAIVLQCFSGFWSSEVEHFDGQAKYNPNLAGRCAQWHRVCHRLSARRPDRVNLFNYRPPFNNAHSIADHWDRALGELQGPPSRQGAARSCEDGGIHACSRTTLRFVAIPTSVSDRLAVAQPQSQPEAPNVWLR